MSLLFNTFSESADHLIVTKTAYFDFIYTDTSAETAQLLVRYADGLADEICLLLDTSMKGRIPVYLNPDVQILNAYFTPYPYNHIVLYDTTPTDGSLGSFHNTILKVFYHELTHAISMNIRTPFWQLMADIFGDALSMNSLLTMPLSFLEGVTVSFESSDGEGRLNDPLTQHFIVQNKIEHTSPTWKDVAGARDVYPGSKASYIYGGAFSSYLQKTYGMEKYAELWTGGLTLLPFLQPKFKSTYNISIGDAWDSFLSSISVPSDIAENTFSLSGTSPGVYSCLASGPDGLVWADGNTGSVWFRKYNGTIIKLFDSDGTLHNLSFSPNGKLLLVSLAEISGASVRAKVRLFDVSSLRFLAESYENLRDASFAGDEETICAIESIAQRTSLVVFSRGNNPVKRVLMTAGPGMDISALYNPVFAGSGTLACIASNGLDRQILLISIDTLLAQKLNLPPELTYIRYLDSTLVNGNPVLSFSWANKETLYRYAVYHPDNNALFLQSKDYSGAVFSPVIDTSGEKIVYIASFSGHDSLLFLDTETNPSLTVKVDAADTDSVSPSPAIPLEIPGSHFYNPLPWFMEGVFIPFPKAMPINTGMDTLAPGFLYVTGDPTERYTLLFNPSFSIEPFFMDTTFQTKIALNDISLSTEINDNLKPALFTFTPYRDTSASLSLNRSFILGPSWKSIGISVESMGHWYAPDIVLFDNPYKAIFESYSLSAGSTVSFSAIRKKKIPQFPLFAVNSTGVSSLLYGYYGVAFPDSIATPVIQGKISVLTPFVPLSLSVSAALADGLSFSPLSVYVSSVNVRDFESGVVRLIPVFPEYDNTVFEYINSSHTLGVVAELTPLSFEIQRGVPLVPLYLNRFLCIAGYRGALFDISNSSPLYIDSVYGKVSLQSSIIMGALTQVLLEANAQYAYALRSDKGRFSFSFTYEMKL